MNGRTDLVKQRYQQEIINTLSNCRIKILQAFRLFYYASHISHCDFYISGAIIFCAYCMASNSKLWFSAASCGYHYVNYCYFEACYVNQSTWIISQGTGVSTTDTKTGNKHNSTVFQKCKLIGRSNYAIYSEFFRITPDNIVQCVNYIVTLKTLKSV